MKIMDWFYKIKLNRKYKELARLNKPIEAMNMDELKIEFTKRLEDANKTGIIDDRLNAIIEYFLGQPSKEKDNAAYTIITLFKHVKTTELRKEVLERYSKCIDEDNITDLTRYIEHIEYSENRKNENNKGALNLTNSDMVKHRINEYKAIIYANNIEKIDLLLSISGMDYEGFELIYSALPENKRRELLLRIQNKYFDITDDERFKKLISSFPEVESIYQQGEIEKEKMTVEEIKANYRRFGKLSLKDAWKLKLEDHTTLTLEEMLAEAKYFINNEFDRENFIEAYFDKITNLDVENIIYDENIEKDIRVKLLKLHILRLPLKGRLELFDKLDDDLKKETGNSFAILGMKSNMTKEEIEYRDELLNKAKGSELYLIYVQTFLLFKKLDIDTAYEIMKSNPSLMDNIQFNGFLRDMTDEQIKELFNIASDKAKSNLITLTRAPFIRNYLAEENNTLPEFILVNKENYWNLLESSEPLTFQRLISIYEYRKLLTQEQKIIILKKIYRLNGNLKLHYSNLFMSELLEGKDIHQIKEILDRIDSKEAYEYLFNKWDEITTDLDGIDQELKSIGSIKNKSIQKRYIEFIIQRYEWSKTDQLDESERRTKIKELLEKNIQDPSTDLENKYLLLSVYFYYTCVGTEICKDEATEKKAVELYKYINELSGKTKYNEFKLEDANLYYISKILPYFYDDDVYELLQKLYKENNSVLETISPALLDKSVLGEIDYELIEFYSRYYTYEDLKKVFENEIKIDVFFAVRNRLYNLLEYPEEKIMDLLNSISILNIDVENLKLGNEKDVDKLIAFLQQKPYGNLQELQKFDAEIKESTRKTINDPLSSGIQLLGALGRRFFNLSYQEMKDIAIKYGEDIDHYIKIYEEKDTLTPEEENELLSLRTVRNIKEILKIQDEKAIIDTFNELDKLEEFSEIDFTAAIVLDENTKRVFSKDYLNDIYIPNDKDKKKINGVEVYCPKEFNMLVSVIGAFSEYDITASGSAAEKWKNTQNKQSHLLCTSYIRNSNLAYVKEDEKEKNIWEKIKGVFKRKNESKKIILGFADIGINAIQMAGVTDIASHTDGIESQKASRYFSFRTADNMCDCVRSGHNEVDIERRLQDNKTENIKPSYVVCIDEITEESRKVAQDFDIPIIYIDRKEIAIDESKKLEELFCEYKKTKNADILKDIVVKYMNNCNSFSFDRKDLMKEYFDEEKMTRKINSIVANLDKEYKIGNRDTAVKGMLSLYNALNNELQNFWYGGIDQSMSTSKKFDIKSLTFELKNRLKSMGVDVFNQKYEMEESIQPNRQNHMLGVIKQSEGINYGR